MTTASCGGLIGGMVIDEFDTPIGVVNVLLVATMGTLLNT